MALVFRTSNALFHEVESAAYCNTFLIPNLR